MAVASSGKSVDGDTESSSSKGRGRGLVHLKKISKLTIRPPRALLEEKGLEVDKGEHEDILSNEKEKFGLLEEADPNLTDHQTNFENTDLKNDQDQEASSATEVKRDLTIEKELNNETNLIEEEQATLVEHEEKTNEEDVVKRKDFDERLVKAVDSLPFVPKAVFNVNAQKFVPKDENEAPMAAQNPEILSDAEESQDSFLLDVFHDTINILTMNPGKFDHVMENLLETITMFITQEKTMDEIASTLIEQAIVEQNFLYSAVRMIKIFLQKLEISREISFKKSFYIRLQNVHAGFSKFVKDDGNRESQSRALGISLLFADLLCNIKTTTGDLNKAMLIAVFKIINQLRENPTEVMVTTLIKVLKLTGPTLDEHKERGLNGKGIPEVDQIFDCFRDPHSNKSWLAHLERSEYLCGQIFNIYKLHSRNWDRELVAQPDKKYIGFNEATSVPSSSASDSESGSALDWNDYCGPEDIDEEGEYDDDYENFLRETGQL